MPSSSPVPHRVSERWLLRRYHRQHDRMARERLVASMMPLVRHLVAGYRHPRFEEDLTQAACFGLTKAIDRWDEARGVELRSYAIPTMHGEVRRWLRDHAWSVHVPRPLQERVLAVTRAADELRASAGRSPTVDAIAKRMGLTVGEVLEALQAGRAYGTASLEAPLSDADAGSLADVLGGDDTRLARTEEIATLGALSGLLDDRDRRVLELRFVEDLTQSEIAARVGCSQMQVSRILRRALGRLSEAAQAPVAA